MPPLTLATVPEVLHEPPAGLAKSVLVTLWHIIVVPDKVSADGLWIILTGSDVTAPLLW